MLRVYTIVFALVFGPLIQLHAQQEPTSDNHPIVKEDRPLRINLNEDGSRFFQLNFLNQLWLRYNQSNPGSTLMGEAAANTFDIGLRRTRMQMHGQITDRSYLYFQFGMNNFNRMTGVGGNRKNAAFFHDAVVEYRVSNANELKIGGGLTITNGLSRFSQPSIGTILTMDVPVFAQATVDQTDIFSRKLSLYARGQIGKIDYRVSLSDPFPVTSSGQGIPDISSSTASFSPRGHHLQQQAYIAWQFWEHESHTTPYMTGTYLGKKRIFNIGGGIINQKNAMWITDASKAEGFRYENMLLWSVESFIDTPLNSDKGTAISAYLGYFNMDYGTNYVRVQAQMNPADPGSINSEVNYFSRGGNGWPMFGSGEVLYGQVGYLLRKNLLNDNGTLQPYISFQRNNLDALTGAFAVYNAGINWLLKGHTSKLSLDYQNRPVFFNSDEKERKGGFILQFQMSI